jgi:hypothetical protein
VILILRFVRLPEISGRVKVCVCVWGGKCVLRIMPFGGHMGVEAAHGQNQTDSEADCSGALRGREVYLFQGYGAGASLPAGGE